MVWDLRRALLAKEEFESSRLTDFEFREMVRALRLVAADLAVEVTPVLHELTDHGLDAGLALLARVAEREPRSVELLYYEARPEARRQLIAERGDPTPYRLG
ncbi:hypothetical protein [Novosphingobium sp. JCM 18896]|uniref:hypothetical protein n=1 Tax=Novosphingobium sp. JCM 18896 TaxID=2989731 RepID=UPI002223395C|nr:hypothetical protein [Novosphingobium sp. JCM 18896]MCW1429045.1 hypothetical protein [Novosphingobium sp. JCM 18896]